MRVGLVLVHFHTPGLVERSLESLIASRFAPSALAASVSGRSRELVACIVDNGNTREGVEQLESVVRRLNASPDDGPVQIERLDPGANLGYAGGIEAGRAALERRHGPLDALIVSNPDVWVEPPAVGKLLEALAAGADVAGPRFFWDAIGSYRLPPIEETTRRADLRRWFAERGRWVERARRRWRTEALRQWQAAGTVSSFALSGALLAIAPRAFERIGGFDPEYTLYFEETDWLERLRVAGGRAVHVPAAEALHLYAQSSPSEPRAAAWLAASQARFRRRHRGRVWNAAYTALSRAQPTPRLPEPEASESSPDAVWQSEPSARRLEISPSKTGFPAAGKLLPNGLDANEPLMPPELWSRLAAGTYRLAAIDETERELAVRWLSVTPQAKSPSPLV